MWTDLYSTQFSFVLLFFSLLKLAIESEEFLLEAQILPPVILEKVIGVGLTKSQKKILNRIHFKAVIGKRARRVSVNYIFLRAF